MLFEKRTYGLWCAFISFLLLHLHCKKEQITDNTYFGSKVMILGHRGMGLYYKHPGNTYESIAPAIGIGSDGCEMDIQLTKDSVLVLYHDHTLNLNTTCTGRISEHTWEEIKGCKYVAVKNDIFICSLEDVFSKLSNVQDLYFSFDCKLDEEVPDVDLYQSQYLRAIKNIGEKYKMTDNIFVEGTQSFLVKAKNMGLTNKLFFAGGLTQSHIDTVIKYSFFGLSSQLDDFEIDADVAHAKGIYVMGYSPYNYYLNLDAIRKKVDILQTDDPISVLKRFERYNYDYVIP